MSPGLKWKTQPTRYELLRLRERLKLAKRAHELLEDKYRMLSLETQKVKDTSVPFEEKMRREFKEAYELLLKAIMHLGMRSTELAAESTSPNDEVEVEWDRIHGLTVPRIRSKIEVRSPLERGYGVSNTAPALDDAAEAFESLTRLMVTVTELRNTHRILEREVKRTRIKVFALERVLIPYLTKEIKRISMKLEERERERHTAWRWISEKTEL